MSGANIPTLIPLLERLPTPLANLLDFQSLSLLVDVFAAIKPSLPWYQDLPHLGPPPTLSSDLQQFFAAVLGIPDHYFPALWVILGEWLWRTCSSRTGGVVGLSREVLEAFRRHGVQRDIVPYNFCPPRYTCVHPECNYTSGREAGAPRVLGRLRSMRAVYFTREHGPIPAKSHSLKCHHCDTRYYCDHFLDAVTHTRTYYGGIPPAILATAHVVLEVSLCVRFTWSTVCAWVSFTNNARIYNLEHRDAIEQFPAGYNAVHRPELTPTLLSDVFFLFALLRDRAERGVCLVHDSHGDQSDRLDALLEDRTLAWVGPGRDNWNHVCDKCRISKVIDGQPHSIRAVVVDGITIGRPCCSVHDCQNPLPSQRARFCDIHSDLNGECVVVGCQERANPNKRTCNNPSHSALEDPSRRSALFVLRRRLERLRTSALDDSGTGLTEELTDYNVDGECPSKSDEGNTKPRARFGRRRTHNEQLVVASCGVILGRATMFGSEGIDGVMKFLKVMFPILLPQVIFFDNACQLKHHIVSLGDSYFDRCIMPVDAFHAKTKHKESDTFCNQHCNAARWPDLFDANDRWIFNSSAAEMTNAWVGGFQAMVREMRAARYGFFLDEVMKWRNQLIVEDLSRMGANPRMLHIFGALGTNTT